MGMTRNCISVASLLALALLGACGQKDAAGTAAGPTPAAASKAEDNTTHWKQTEKFGTVNAIVLDGSATLPARFDAYQRQVATEWLDGEYQKQPDSAFEDYLALWVRQAASVPAPDWGRLAGIVHAEQSEESNEFKKADAAAAIQKELKPDPASLNMVMAWQGDIGGLSGPDVSNGEYYLNLRPGHRTYSVAYNTGKRRMNLRYEPVFGFDHCDSCRDMSFTVKVPIERAREIESLREKGQDMVRLWGHVTGLTAAQLRDVDRQSASAALSLEVEAIEVGSRQGGEFVRYFVITPEQLARWKR